MSDSKFGYLLEAEGQIDPSDIVAEVARGFNVTVKDILGKSHMQHVVRARKTAIAAVREMTELSYPAMGRLFKRHHTTVIHHVTTARDDPRVMRALALVIARHAEKAS